MMEEEGARNQRPGANTKILALGDNGNCLLYDSVNKSWEEWPAPEPETPTPDTPDHGTHFGAVVVGGNIFIIGGKVENKSQARVSIYNVETRTWTDGPSLHEARCRMGTCVSSTNSIYVVGGSGDNRYPRSVEMLNCNQRGEPTGGWQTLPPSKILRKGVEAAIVDDKVYAIGGSSKNAAATMDVFDPILKSWTYCKTRGYYYHAVSTYNGEIYVFGRDGSCGKYNPVTNTWTVIAALDTKARGRGSAVLNDKIYLIGGYCCTETDIYDVATNMWLRGPPMPRQIGPTKCVLLN